MAKIFFMILIFSWFSAACSPASTRTNPVAPSSSISPPSPILPHPGKPGCLVGGAPDKYRFDPFYQKYCDAGGIPVIGSAQVADLALQQAYEVITHLLAPIPQVRQELVANGAYFAVVGKNERLTDLPEYAHLDSQYWDQRARGLGGSQQLPLTSSPEENLLCLAGDRYVGESIAVHEFAHTISLIGLGDQFEALFAEFNHIYAAALQQGLWANTYAISDIQEYWAEGVQTYFNANPVALPGDTVHNLVNTRTEMKDYDPDLFNFLDRFFNGYDWTPVCP